MKILLTGGAGFIGSALVRHILAQSEASVVTVDKLTYAGHLANLGDALQHPRHVFVQADVCDAAATAQIFATHQPDAVAHLAAESHVDRSLDGPRAFMDTNVLGTFTLLEAARAYWQALPAARQAAFRFLHVSTDEVYGDLPHPDEGGDAHVLFTEETPYAPSSPYSASKAASDHLARAWQRSYGLPTLVSHCSNNYGPYHYPEKFIPLLILNALEGQSLPVYGGGQQIRDWLFVEDHARALWLLLQNGAVGGTYNIGGHNEVRNIEVAQQVCALLDELGPRRDTPYASLIAHVADRPGHDRRYAIDASKIERELGWRPQESFETGLRKTVAWYLAHGDWCRQVQADNAAGAAGEARKRRGVAQA